MTRALHVFAIAWFAAACAGTHPATSFTKDGEADALHAEAVLYASPERDAFDPERGAALLQLFVDRYPADVRRPDALRQLALVKEIVALRAELRALKAIDLGRSPRD
ncbi:MAG: hypothetical protein ACREOK_07530 [Gemmatimonadaceae bacterium]